MKYLIFSLLIGLISCGESLETDVFIERKKEVDNVVISGKIQNGAGLEISLEAPLLQSRGTKVQVVKGIIDKNNSFTLNTQIPGLGYYILKLNSKSSDSLELTLKNGDQLSLNTSVSEFTTKPNYSGVSWAEDANMYQQILNAPLSKENLSSYAFKRMKENPVNPFNIIHSMHLMNDENEYNESRIQLFFEVANAFYSYYPGSEPSNNFQKQTVFLRKYMENNAFYDVPEISLKTPDNKTLNLSSLKGKYVLVDFWASWCGPCRRENPNVVKLYKKYRKKNFTVYSVSLDEDGTKWKQAIKMDNLIWPNHVSDLKGWQSSVVPMFNIQGIPYTVLVNPEGKIIGINLRGQELENKLEEIFKS
jgi:thiol-disulfide isomerase/thioredoxin